MYRAPDHDVLIAGAGPAGAHTALRLARLGWKVALLDARTFPRKKPCGEFMSPACLPLLDELDLLAPLLATDAARVRGMDIVAESRRARGDYEPIGPFAASHGFGLGIRRERLDLMAVEAAAAEPNVTTLLGWRVSAPLRDADGRAIGLAVKDPSGRSRTLSARFVVGADGVRSRVGRGLGWNLERRTPDRFAIVARFDDVANRERAGLYVTGRDYFAACPIDDGAFTANLVVDAADLPRGAAALEAFFEQRLERAPALAERLRGARLREPLATCGPLRSGTRRVAGPGVALVGDAGGFVDPLTGEGLYLAMQGARLLAPALDAALSEPSREAAALRSYARGRRREIAPRHALAKLLQKGLRRPGVPERVVGLLASRPAVCDLVLGLTGDYVPPRGLVAPSVWRGRLARAQG